MSLESDQERLLAPIEGDSPAGVDLEDTALLASFDSLRVFGNMKPFAKDAEPNWRGIRGQAFDALGKSKDLRVLAYWTLAALQMEGWPGLGAGLQVAANWLQASFDQVFPRPDGKDATLRKNSLGYFADRSAMLDAVRRAPLASTRQLGSVSLRDLALAAGELAVPEGEKAPTTELIGATFAAVPIDDLRAMQKTVDGAATALKGIDESMRAFGGSEAAPALDGLVALVARASETLAAQIAAHPAAAGAEGGADDAAGASAAGATTGRGPPGAIRTREDAIRVLDSVAAFFRSNEPSSPVPLFIERAKRLVGKNFLEALEDVAPAALPDARQAGGVREPGT